MPAAAGMGLSVLGARRAPGPAVLACCPGSGLCSRYCGHAPGVSGEADENTIL
ncbi:MAG: hypothetical protein FWF71_04650 [Actinomycetia bacterium]|nr:hypothetical protein [Actinomycetes bacterium]